jgi:hypothetical protein
MTQSIISLGKAFPLDSLQRAILALDFGKLAVKDLRIPAHQLVRLFQLAKMTN